MKIAFLFAGQGSQYVGMGKDLANNIKESMEVFDKAKEVLDFDIKKLCFEDPDGVLNKTEYTQPAILTVNIAALKAIEKEVKPDVLAGLSLGEYGALVAGEVIDFKDGVDLVRKRGKFMEEAVPSGVGGMSAVLGLKKEVVEDTLKTITEGIVEISNFNCPGQIVIGGEVKALKIAGEKLKDAGAKRVIPLTVSGPFHTSMLEEAALRLEKELENIEFNKPSIPIISNVNADYVKVENIKTLLKQQVKSSVLFEQSINKMLEDGIDTFIELGPGKALSSFVKKVNRKVTVCNIEDMKSLEKTLKTLGR